MPASIISAIDNRQAAKMGAAAKTAGNGFGAGYAGLSLLGSFQLRLLQPDM